MNGYMLSEFDFQKFFGTCKGEGISRAFGTLVSL